MAIITKEAEIQEKLSVVYEDLINKKNHIQLELTRSRINYKNACDRHIATGFACECEWMSAENLHRIKFIEYDIYCHLLEIVTDFRDLYGDFPDYQQMCSTLNLIMLQFAKVEEYELAGILKNWVDRINLIITESEKKELKNTRSYLSLL